MINEINYSKLPPPNPVNYPTVLATLIAKVIAAVKWIWVALNCLAASNFVPSSNCLHPAKNYAQFSQLSQYEQEYQAGALATHARAYGFVLKNETVKPSYDGLCCGSSLLMAKIYLATGSIEKAALAFSKGAPREAAELQMWYSLFRLKEASPQPLYCDLLMSFFETFRAHKPTAESIQAFLTQKLSKNDDIATLLVSASALYLLEKHELNVDYPEWVSSRLKKDFKLDLPAGLYSTMREVVNRIQAADGGGTANEWDAIRATASLIDLQVSTPLYHHASPQEILQTLPSWDAGVYFIGIPSDFHDVFSGGHACTFIKNEDGSYFFDINEGTKKETNEGNEVKEAFAAYYGKESSPFSAAVNRLIGRPDFDPTKKAAFEVYKLSETVPEPAFRAQVIHGSCKQAVDPMGYSRSYL